MTAREPEGQKGEGFNQDAENALNAWHTDAREPFIIVIYLTGRRNFNKKFKKIQIFFQQFYYFTTFVQINNIYTKAKTS